MIFHYFSTTYPNADFCLYCSALSIHCLGTHIFLYVWKILSFHLFKYFPPSCLLFLQTPIGHSFGHFQHSFKYFNLPWTFPFSSSLYYSLVKFFSLIFYFINLVWVCPMYGLNWEFWSPFCILQWYGFLFKSISLVLDTYLFFFFLNSHVQQYSIYLAVYLLFILISLWELYSYFWSLFPIA